MFETGNISLYTGSGCIGIKAESGNRNSSYGGKQAVRKRTRGRFYQDTVFPQNIDGMRFYEKNGFREMMKTIESSLD